MAELKYKNIEDESGERIATNAFYTGHKLATPTQDAADGADNAPYVVSPHSHHRIIAFAMANVITLSSLYVEESSAILNVSSVNLSSGLHVTNKSNSFDL